RQLPEEALLQGMVTREAAEVLWHQKNTALAYKAAEASVPATSTDYRDHLWRGQIFKVLGKPDKAEESFRKAGTLRPDNADASAPVLRFVARTDKEKAAEELKKAEKRVPRELARLAFAACYEALGQTDQSEALLKAALAAQPDDPVALRNYAAYLLRAGRVKDAMPQLRKLGEFRAKAPADAEWALSVLALLLASDSDWKNAREALSIVAELEKTQGPGSNGAGPVSYQRLKALVLAMQKGR